MKGKGEPKRVAGLVGAGTFTNTHAQKGILERIAYAHACEDGISETDQAIIERMNSRMEILREKQTARKRGA